MPFQEDNDILQTYDDEIISNRLFLSNNISMNTSYDKNEWKPIRVRLDGKLEHNSKTIFCDILNTFNNFFKRKNF